MPGLQHLRLKNENLAFIQLHHPFPEAESARIFLPHLETQDQIGIGITKNKKMKFKYSISNVNLC